MVPCYENAPLLTSCYSVLVADACLMHVAAQNWCVTFGTVPPSRVHVIALLRVASSMPYYHFTSSGIAGMRCMPCCVHLSRTCMLAFLHFVVIPFYAPALRSSSILMVFGASQCAFPLRVHTVAFLLCACCFSTNAVRGVFSVSRSTQILMDLPEFCTRLGAGRSRV